MKTRISFLMLIMSMVMTSAFSQDKSKKELKEEEKLQKQTQVENLINSQKFVFVATYALPMGSKSINLTSNPNYIKFDPELFDGYMPFFGTGYIGLGPSGDNTIKFKDKPESYTIEKKKKNFQIDARVKGENDVYRLSLSVSFDGNASLSIVSNNRSSISYQGGITPVWSKEK